MDSSLLALLTVLCTLLVLNYSYDPTWDSLDKRPIPLWYDDSKFGIFMHFGLYSYVGMGDAWFWYFWKVEKSKGIIDYMDRTFKPGFDYPDFEQYFTADLFDADRFAQIIAKSGARYLVLTSKHHEGYAMYKSNYSWNWNSVETGPHRDILADMSAAIRKTDVVFGLYFSQYAWFHPLWLKDYYGGLKTQDYVNSVSFPQLKEIVNAYKPQVIWSDGDWSADCDYWKSTEFLAWLYNESPVKDTVVVNDRWGAGAYCKHGDFWNCQDKFNPGHLLKHKWESCMTIDKGSWGFRRTARYEDFMTIEELIATLASVISCGGNLLLNVGPTHDGRITPIFEERLTQMGQFVETNKEAIFGTKPWIYQNDTEKMDVWYVSKLNNDSGFDPRRSYNPQISDNTVVYAYVLKWPTDGVLKLNLTKATVETTVKLLGYPGKLKFVESPSGSLTIDFTKIVWTKMANTWSWVLKLEKLDNDGHVPNLYEASQFEVLDEKRKLKP